MFHPNALFIDGKVVSTERAFGLRVDQPNSVWLKTDTVDEERRNSIIRWLVANEDRGESVWVAGEQWGKLGKPPFLVLNDGSACWSHYAFDTEELAQDFAAEFCNILVTPRDFAYPELDTGITVERIDGPVWERTDKKGVKSRYYHAEGDMWFSDSPYAIIKDRIGVEIEPGKVRNLMSWSGERTLDIFYYLDWVLRGHKPEVANEIVNFILGPMAVAMKGRDLGFEKRDLVIHSVGLRELATALSVGIIPDGSRKDLYAALIARFNVELGEVLQIIRGTIEYDEWYSARDAVRIVFYGILSDVLEPIFSQAGGAEIDAMIKAVLDANPAQAALVASGDQKVIGWAMGQVMRASPTKLDPATVRAAILKFQG